METIRNIPELLGHTMRNVYQDSENQGDLLVFERTDGTKITFYHYQSCCEGVWIDVVEGEFEDLVGSPILKAEVYTQGYDPRRGDDIGQYTFYTFATIKGTVQVMWRGESNGYYSIDVYMRIED